MVVAHYLNFGPYKTGKVILSLGNISIWAAYEFNVVFNKYSCRLCFDCAFGCETHSLTHSVTHSLTHTVHRQENQENLGCETCQCNQIRCRTNKGSSLPHLQNGAARFRPLLICRFDTKCVGCVMHRCKHFSWSCSFQLTSPDPVNPTR